MDIVVCLITVVAAYLLGSIPTGYLAGRARGIDIRTVGSGNIGATNVFRMLGRTAGSIVLAVDGMKGWVAVTLVPALARRLAAPDAWSDPGSIEYFENHRGLLGHPRP